MRKLTALFVLGVLAACGGGGGTGGVTPVQTATPSPTPTPLPPPPNNAPIDQSTIISAEEDTINGNQTWYTSGTSSWSNNSGGTSSAPDGSNPVDGSTCNNVRDGETYPSTEYTEHLFVGIYYNGVEETLPQAIGMPDPQPPTTAAPPDWPTGHSSDTYAVELSKCRYNVHVHDYSGLVHVQDPTLPQSTGPMPSYAKLQTLFDVWGAQLTSNGIVAGSNALSGRAIVYAGTPTGTNQGNDLVGAYTLYNNSDLGSLQFARHMAVWIVIGPLPPQGLPAVQIVQEY